MRRIGAEISKWDVAGEAISHADAVSDPSATPRARPHVLTNNRFSCEAIRFFCRMIFEHDETSQLPTRCRADPDTGNLRLAPRLPPARSLSMIHPSTSSAIHTGPKDDGSARSCCDRQAITTHDHYALNDRSSAQSTGTPRPA